MTVMGENASAAGVVPGAHRVVRLLDADEGPFRGALVSAGQTVAVLVDAASLSGWVGWTHAGSEHVAAPGDLVRRADGHGVLVPWCTERITMFLGRRESAGAPLEPGEITTLAGSVLRGIDELGASGVTEPGDWWLTVEGRPVFAFGRGPRAREGAGEILAHLAENCGDRALTRVLDGIRMELASAEERPQLARACVDRWEADLMEVAAPRPLRREIHAPEPIRSIPLLRREAASTPSASAAGPFIGPGVRGRAAARMPRPVVGSGDAGEGETTVRSCRAQAHAARLSSRRSRDRAPRRNVRAAAVRDGAAWIVSAVLAEWDRRFRAHHPAGGDRNDGRPVNRRRIVLVAAVTTGVVLATGLMWPHAESDTGGEAGGASAAHSGQSAQPSRATTDDRKSQPQSLPKEPSAEGKELSSAGGADTESTREEPHPTDPVADTPDDAASLAEDPVNAARALLLLIRTCADDGDTACANAVAPGSAIDAQGIASLQKPNVELVDSYGDVAVVRVRSASDDAPQEGASERMIVLVRQEEKWLVRDVYSVADQPE